eukprot:gb/GECG01004957.1/.p1 GENE.gb/GECG01004957.1/~~gb/GECG01004957.1/.p1  ORF type:complete len:139 (+),score=10.16 gb/GECG01004957.1/:1-417(+)
MKEYVDFASAGNLVRILVVMVKAWSRSTVGHGSALSGYSLMNLALFFLQQAGVLPVLILYNDMRDEDTITVRGTIMDKKSRSCKYTLSTDVEPTHIYRRDAGGKVSEGARRHFVVFFSSSTFNFRMSPTISGSRKDVL